MYKFFLGSLFACSLSAAEYGFSTYNFIDPKTHIHVEARYRPIRGAHFQQENYGKLYYADGYASLNYTEFVDEDNALSLDLQYDYLKLGWKQNPQFRQEHFNYATSSIGYITTIVDKWRWVLSAGFSVDANNFNFNQTAVYHGIFWGRYQFEDYCGIHVGFTGWYGCLNGYALAIVGADWMFGSSIKMTVVFPFESSLKYIINDSWSFDAAYSGFGGPYRYPRRANQGIGSEHPIFELYSNAADFNFNYHYKKTLRLSVGGGWNFGGWIWIANQNNQHGKYYNYNSAPYMQGSFALTF